MNIDVIKNTIKDLVDQSNSIGEENDNTIQSSQFTRPFFESLGWDFNVDVKSENFEGSEIKAFQIDNVTRFYLKEFPLTSPLESLTDEIKSTVSYAYNKGVTWAVITNFKETRVYNTESTGRTLGAMQHYSFLSSEYIEKFQKLSDLTKKQFSLNVLDDSAEYFGKKPKRVSIDKQLLEDLLAYRNILVDDIVKENSISENDVEFVAQKILNRLIFIRSCGDRQIENRFLKEELYKWEEKKDKKLIYHLQDIFSYFRGRYGSTLFEKHLCDEVIISDKVLQQVIEGTYQSKKKAVRYNFAHIEHDSLGKMYENYLGTVQQKKDGAYYTPSYISKYICQNTIIPYLSKSDVTNIPDLILEYSDNLEELESKIYNIKILDPACGTGEFLIRAIDVLLEISTEIQAQKEVGGQYTHTVKGKKSGTVSYQTFGKDVENKEIRKIIQNNIHGVDINKEAIEITQLNMFLKLATSSQQLIDLTKKVMVGNSLIDDPNVDPNAFDWNKEFPEKFDIVIGNPPYVKIQEIKNKIENAAKYFSSIGYNSATKSFDLSVLFIEKGYALLSENGKIGYITTNKFLNSEYGVGIRDIISKNNLLSKLIDFGDQQIFSGATTYTCIIFLENKNKKLIKYAQIKNIKEVDTLLKKIEQKEETNSKDLLLLNIKKNEISKNPWVFFTKEEQKIFQKINNFKKLDAVAEIYQGITTSADKVYLLKFNFEKENNFEAYSSYLQKNIYLEKDLLKYLLKGTDIEKWNHKKVKNLLFFPFLLKNQTITLVDEQFLSSIPNTYQYLKNCKSFLSLRKLPSNNKSFVWYDYVYRKNLKKFEHKKILTQVLAKKSTFALDSVGTHYFVGGGNAGIYGIQIMNENELSYEYLLGLLNSSLLDWCVKKKSTRFHSGYYSYAKRFLVDLPIFISKNDSIVMKIEKLVKDIISNKNIMDNIQNNEKIFQINQKILKNEQEINKLVYKLYEITDEEKAIIESSV